MATSFITTVIDGLKETYKTRLNRLNISFINPQVTISDSGQVQVQEEIPVASKDVTGLVQIGEGIEVNEDGMISVNIPVIPTSLTTEQTEQVENMISTASQEVFSQVSLMVNNLSQGMDTEISSINTKISDIDTNISSLKERITALENSDSNDDTQQPIPDPNTGV